MEQKVEIKGILLDAYGVFWSGGASGVFPGALETMEHCISRGKIVGVLSNSTQSSQREMKKVEAYGMQKNKHFHFYLTSGEITHRLLMQGSLPFPTPHKRFYLLGGDHPQYSPSYLLFEGSPYQETKDLDSADFIYITIPHIRGENQIDPSVFDEELKRLEKKNIPMLCANPDLFAHEGHPPQMVVRQGSIAMRFQALGGEVFYIGKPHPLAFQAALEQFSQYGISQPQEVLMIGDTPEIDIRGAKAVGMRTALVKETGMMKERIRQLGLLQAQDMLLPQDAPDFWIEGFRSGAIAFV